MKQRFLRVARAARLILLCSLCSCVVPAAYAQVLETSVLRGRITDQTDLPLKEARVVVRSSNLLGGERIVLSDDRGDYHAGGLPAGTYELTASHAGFADVKRTNLIVGQDVTVIADMRLQLAAMEQAVTIDAPLATVDVTTSANPARLDRVLLENLPTDRVVSELMNLTPGVNGAIALGGVFRSNGIYVDGVNMTDILMGAPWVAFNPDWLEEVQVIGPGAGAQYSDFSGVLQKARLKSGSDAFRGSGSLYFTRPRWFDSNTASLSSPLQQSLSPERMILWHDEGIDAGGPLARGRLWAYGGLQNVRHQWTPALYSGPEYTEDSDHRGVLRMDGAAGLALRLTGLYEHDTHRTYADGLSRFDSIEVTTTDSQPNDNWRASARWARGSTVLELATVGAGGELTMDPTRGTRSGPAPHYDEVTGLSSQNSSYYLSSSSRRRVLSATAIRDLSLFGQSHTLDAGGEFESDSQQQVYGYPGGEYFIDDDGVPAYVYIWPGSDNMTWLHRAAAYLQDRWAAGRVTIEPGIRFTFNRGIVSQGIVLSTNPISPRLGVAWDVTRTHDTVVRLHVGRYHDALLTPNLEDASADLNPDEIFARVLGPGHYVEVSRSSSNTRVPIDPQITQPYFDQYVVSAERTLSPSLSVTGQVLARRFRNFMGMVDGGSMFTVVTLQDPGPDNRPGTSDDQGTVTAFQRSGTPEYVLTNPAGFHRNYTSTQLSARYRPAMHVEASAAYTYSKSRGNAENTLRANAGGPEFWTNGVSADPNRLINNDGPNTFDFTHEAKVLGTWQLPYWGGFVLSGVYRYHTGGAWGRSVHFTNALNDFVTYGVRVEPRDAHRTPSLSALDLRAEKQIPLRGGSRIHLLLDGFNLTNQGIPDSEQRRAIWEVSGAAFGQPQYWIAPRSARAGVRVTF